jgi:hypothetical protein
MLLTSEQERGEIRMRVLACDCEPGCESRYVAFQCRHESLWVVMILATGGDEEVDVAVDLLFGDETGIDDLPGLVELYLALLGMSWPVLVASERACGDQHLVASTLPGWMLRLNAGLVWRTRRVVFGHDLMRVPGALKATAAYYEPDEPVPTEAWLR